MFYAAFSLEFCVWLRTLVFDEAGLVGIQGEPAIIVLICSFPIWHKFHIFFFWRASSRILCLSLWFLGVCQENDKRKCKRSETQVQNGQKQGKGAQIKKLATSIFQKKSWACILKQTNLPHWRIFQQNCINATMDKWRKYFFDSALSFFGNLWTPDVLLGFTSFLLQASHRCFWSVCCVCCPFRDLISDQILYPSAFLLALSATWTPEGFSGFRLFLCQKWVMLMSCLQLQDST